jgi:hypothetical protein
MTTSESRNVAQKVSLSPAKVEIALGADRVKQTVDKRRGAD